MLSPVALGLRWFLFYRKLHSPNIVAYAPVFNSLSEHQQVALHEGASAPPLPEPGCADEYEARCDELRLLHMHMGASVAETIEQAIAAGKRPVPGPLAAELVSRAAPFHRGPG